MSDASTSSNQNSAPGWPIRSKEDSLRAIARLPVHPSDDARNQASVQIAKRLASEALVDRLPDETSALPHASAALKDFMAHLGEIMSMEDGATPADYLQRARDIREWCHDHQTLPELEYSEHCGCCVRNKITVEVFGRPAVEPSPEQPKVCPIHGRDPDTSKCCWRGVYGA